MNTNSHNKKHSVNFKTLVSSFVICFLPLFMCLIFYPAETFFANAAELPFVYREFAPYLAIAAFVITIVVSIIISFLPDFVKRLLYGLIFSVSLCFYIQSMFLNKNLDLMGLSAEGYVADSNQAIINLLVWLIIIVIVLLLVVLSRKDQIPVLGSLFLLAIQVVALVSLWLNADASCYRYPDSEYHLTGEKQFCVSDEENIILFILDSYSTLDLNAALVSDPTVLDSLNDFVFYNNMDSVYCGTYPSVPHMLTCNNVNFSMKVNEWTKSAWNSDKATYFYDSMKANDFICNLYTPDLNLLCGSNNTEELLDDKFDNFSNSPLSRVVANSRVCKVCIKMACYRMVPNILKSLFNVNISEYFDSVAIEEYPVAHENYDFSSALYDRGLTAESGYKLFCIQHLMGTHIYSTDRSGGYCENSTPEDTAIGCLHIVNEYINELKSLGVYDCSTIIITADHGFAYGQQPIFFVKEKNVHSDKLSQTDAPCTFNELLPSIASFAGIDPEPIGETFASYHDGEKRERTLYIMYYYDTYPKVKSYYGDKDGAYNVYEGYTYTGDGNELFECLNDDPSTIIPMADSFF